MNTTTSATNAPVAPTASSAGAGIAAALGSGSGIDSAALVDKLVSVNKFADQNRITTKKTLLQDQISDFGLLRSSFSKLESTVTGLGNPDTFNAKSVSVPTTNLLSISKLDAAAAAGSYSINVDQLAKAQSISTAALDSQTASVGKGKLTIRFGEWNLARTTFTPDATKTGGTITIDDSNNSLIGVKDAINKANLGVSASIVTDNGKFKLLVTAPSGEFNEIDISATETPGALGLAQFNYNQTTKNMLPQQDGADAKIRVNGLLLTRSTNHITDVIQGLEFDLANTSLTETVSIGVVADKSIAEKAIRDFVVAYNTFLDESSKLTGFNKEKNAYGSLHQDPLAKNLLQQVRSQLHAPISGLSGTFTNFSSLGIRTELDGTLTIDDDAKLSTSFRSAIDKNFEAVRDLFVPKSTSSNAKISVTKNSANSVPGNYDVNILQQPAKGYLIGAATVALFSLDTTGKTYTFTAKIDGVSASPITLPTTTYLTGSALAADIQTRINADAALVAAKASVNVNYNSTTQKLEFTSATYGSSSKVSISDVSADMADLGISNDAGTAGVDVSGTVGGVAAFGFGNVLLPAIGSKAEGLSMNVEEGATTATISFSRGFSGSFTGLIDNFLKTNGLIKNHEKSIRAEVDKNTAAQKTLDKRSNAYKARLQAQFSAMESIVRGLKSTGTFLTGAFKALSGDSNSN